MLLESVIKYHCGLLLAYFLVIESIILLEVECAISEDIKARVSLLQEYGTPWYKFKSLSLSLHYISFNIYITGKFERSYQCTWATRCSIV